MKLHLVVLWVFPCAISTNDIFDAPDRLFETLYTEGLYCMFTGNLEQSKPGKGVWETLHPTRVAILSLCGDKGKTLFGFLLASAQSLPDSVQEVTYSGRLCDIANELGWSPDTVKRYVAVFRAMHLVSHFHDRRQERAMLRLPLGPYPPLTNFALLDDLIFRTRTKQRQLAMRVKQRYLAHFGDPTQGYSQEVRTGFQALRVILEEEHLEPLKRQRLQLKLADLLSQCLPREHAQGDRNLSWGETRTSPLLPVSGSTSTVGDSSIVFVSSPLSSPPLAGKNLLLQGDVHAQPGDPALPQSTFSHDTTGLTGDEHEMLGDLTSPLAPCQPGEREDLKLAMGDVRRRMPVQVLERHQSQEDPKGQQGDLALPSHAFLVQEAVRLEDPKQQQGDVVTGRANGPVPEREAQGDLGPSEGDLIGHEYIHLASEDAHVGDLQQQIVLTEGDPLPETPENRQAAAPLTYNVSYLIQNITSNYVIRKQLAQFLASVLEQHHMENGYPTFSKYLKAFTRYAPEVIGRAFLVTMVLLHRKHWQVECAGALFTKQCKVLSGALPLTHYTLDEVEAWVRAWGDLPYADLPRVLAFPAPVRPLPAPLVTANRLAPSLPVPSGSGGWDSIPPRKRGRTYGMQYTGKPTVRKGFNTTGPARPPHLENT
jgi:hypothetical protein